VCTSVVSGCDASPVLDPAEHVLDTITLSIQVLVVFSRVLPFGAGRDAGGNSHFFQSVAEPVRIVAAICEQILCAWQSLEQVARALVVTGLAGCQKEQQGPAQAVCDSVQLGVQAAFRTSDTAGKSPFFSRLAAVR
jgi:hypothetical protein